MENLSSESEYAQMASKVKTSATVEILTNMTGLTCDSSSSEEFNEKIRAAGIVPEDTQADIFSNACKSLSALEKIYNCSLISFGKSIPLSIAQLIFDKLHVKLYRRGKEGVLDILTNGYQIILLLMDEKLTNPFIFQIIVYQLCQYVSDYKLSALVIKLFLFVIGTCERFTALELIAEHSICLLSALDTVFDISIAENDSDLRKKVLHCTDKILAYIRAFALQENGDHLSVALNTINCDAPELNAIACKYGSASDFGLQGLSRWIQKYSPGKGYTKKPFARLETLLDAEEKKDIDSPEWQQLAQRILSILDSHSVGIENEVDLHAIACYSKLLFLVPNSRLLGYTDPLSDLINLDDNYARVLSLLLPYFSESNPEIVSKCIKVTTNLLAQPEGDVAFQKLNPKLQQYYNLFRGRKLLQYRSATAKEGILQFNSFGESEALWLSTFSTQLLVKLDFPDYFKTLESVLLCCPDFASKILPVLFHFKLFHDLESKNQTNGLAFQFVQFFTSLSGNYEDNKISILHFLNIIKVLFIFNSYIYIVFIESGYQICLV